ncbi:MAG: response regulator [Neptuniibacter sp.]
MRKVSTPIDKTIVMIVEDMQAMRMMIKTSLKHMGFKNFAECTNGYEASKRLKLMHVDLIVCDFDMPEKNGLEFLQEVRASERNNNTPFIMLTANSSANLIHQCISAGVDSYMVKPFQPLALCKKINNMLLTPLEDIA